MKLTTEQITRIVSALSPYIENQRVELRSYTALVQEDRNSDSIDLLLFASSDVFAQILKVKKNHMLDSIEKAIGKHKINLQIFSESEVKKDIYLEMILPESLLLHSWQL